MELRLKYGSEMMSADFKPPAHFAEAQPKHIVTLQKPLEILNQALNRTLGCHPFNHVFRGTRNVVIVTPNPADVVGAEYYLPLLRERFNRLGVRDEEIRVLVAAPVDSWLCPSEPPQISFAELVGDKVRVFWHDPHDHKSLTYAGLTRRGTPVFVNRLLMDADCVLLSGSVSHHPLAGYGAGPRLILPGCAGEESIYRHFSHAFDHENAFEPEGPQIYARCRDATVEGNPLQEDSREALRFMAANFLLHTVLNDQQQIVGAVAGEPLQAFSAGCKAIDSMFGALTLPPAAQLLVVSCGGFPHDRDFRTARLPLLRALQFARPHDVIIFLAECREGLGSEVLSLFLQAGPEQEVAADSSRRPPAWLHQQFRHNELEVLMTLAVLQRARARRVIMVTELEARVVQRLGFLPARSLREALAVATPWLRSAELKKSQHSSSSPAPVAWESSESGARPVGVVANGTLFALTAATG
ncbi:MAG: lactate racemase domain-containing protein [candidate division KSB1 bacterium]|nr:lactate racemase domain-containing protein [candidate division KSB1 bacterium]MDZ7366028.1 lactate racemase domain-containing protein [candidate division KSB1 bacterium]MDZ7404145.1 lactate racemase domain-containing protein [candidate division KSB1 bacterium]